ncbi:hypothetical protein CANCADRAFT_19081, partial [Tortispora caseinolytica NRRL Y-17796]
IVIWHGLGDHYDSGFIEKCMDLLVLKYPQSSVYSIRMDDDPEKDKQYSLVGDMNQQVQKACDLIANISDMTDTYYAIGMSQGGLFLRGVLERCNTGPQMKRLLTFGSPHMGISDLPKCDTLLCKARNNLLKKQIWTDWTQHNVVPAQYFRDPNQLDLYLNHSHFLADINNERLIKNSTYKLQFQSLDKLSLVMFDSDQMVTPKESAWFSEENMPFNQSVMYTNNWLGLQELHQQGKIILNSLEGEHMRFTDTQFLDLVAEAF